MATERLRPTMVMKWPLRPLFSKKFQVNLALNRLDGLSMPQGGELDGTKLHVDVKWKGPKGALGSRFRSIKRGKTSAASVGLNGGVTWEEEFENICVFTTGKTGTFQPWHVYLVLCKVTQICSHVCHLRGVLFPSLCHFKEPVQVFLINWVCIREADFMDSALQS